MIEELKILDNETSIFDTEAFYVIPRYQREYAWEDKEIIQLIDDINGIKSSENYYIGSLIVSRARENSERYEVVDGQQRLTTLYLLLQYLRETKQLGGTIKPNLTFDCRPDSVYTLNNIQSVIRKVLNKNLVFNDGENIESSILNGIKVINQQFHILSETGHSLSHRSA